MISIQQFRIFKILRYYIYVERNVRFSYLEVIPHILFKLCLSLEC